MELPMLDEEEFTVISKLVSQCMSGAKDSRMKNNYSLSDTPIADLFRPVREAYLKMTGMDESNTNTILHHRLSLYGPACEYCGKPLRTPRASFCAACGKVPSVRSQA
jgi:hypothetical protein